MNSIHPPRISTTIVMVLVSSLSTIYARAQPFSRVGFGPPTAARSQAKEVPWASSHLIQPQNLVDILNSAKGRKPLVVQVGFRVLYVQAHIPGSEFIGPASTAGGIRRLKNFFEALPRKRFIVLYCGCCPWNECPNVKPAYKELRTMGFKNVVLLYLPHNFDKDWVEKGYPVARSR